MSAWEDLTPKARDWMRDLGNFGPTVRAERRELKGYTHDDEGAVKTYWTSADLRELAWACIEVAGWLDHRADEQAKEPKT